MKFRRSSLLGAVLLSVILGGILASVVRSNLEPICLLADRITGPSGVVLLYRTVDYKGRIRLIRTLCNNKCKSLQSILNLAVRDNNVAVQVCLSNNLGMLDATQGKWVASHLLRTHNAAAIHAVFDFYGKATAEKYSYDAAKSRAENSRAIQALEEYLRSN